MSSYPTIIPWRYRIGRALAAIGFGVGSRLHVTGLEHVPRRGPLIVVTNHVSIFDGPLVFAELPLSVNMMVAKKYASYPLLHPLLHVAGAIYVEQDRPDRRAMRMTLEVLARGGCIAVAVEGTRSHTGGLIRGKAGTAYLAKRARVPLLPVVVYGTEKIRASVMRLRRTDVHMVIGPAFELPPGALDVAELESHTEHIMLRLASMLPSQYRGIYGNEGPA